MEWSLPSIEEGRAFVLAGGKQGHGGGSGGT
jgi:hypothetical protein